MNNPKISCMIHTASFDGFLSNQGIKSYFESVTNNLSNQSFKDFEFVFVDTFYDSNKDEFEKIISTLPFVVKHVPIHANHRYWYDKGYVYISAAKNTGILYADGELLITCDDAEFFPEHLFQKYWNHYQSGYFMQAVHKRMKTIKTENGVPIHPISGDIYINDHRISSAKEQIKRHKHGNQSFAGTSFSLKDAVTLNGFNERMDGCKSLEDCEFGERMVLINRNFVIDLDGFFYILDHQSYGDIKTTVEDGQLTDPSPIQLLKKKEIANLIAIENYGMLRCSVELFEPKANRGSITDKHLKIIQRETIKYRKFDPLAPEHKDKLDLWLNTPTFDLKLERSSLRASPEWRWK